MKLLLAALLSSFSLSVSAAPALVQKVSLSVRKVSAAEALEQLSKNSGVSFSLSSRLHTAKLVSIEVKDVMLKDILNFFATEMGAKWEAAAGNSVKFTVKR